MFWLHSVPCGLWGWVPCRPPSGPGCVDPPSWQHQSQQVRASANKVRIVFCNLISETAFYNLCASRLLGTSHKASPHSEEGHYSKRMNGEQPKMSMFRDQLRSPYITLAITECKLKSQGDTSLQPPNG